MKRFSKIIGFIVVFVAVIAAFCMVSSAIDGKFSPTHEYNFDSDANTTAIDNVSSGAINGIATGTTLIIGSTGTGYARHFDGSSYITFNDKVMPLGEKSISFKIRKNTPAVSSYEFLFSNLNDSSIQYGLLCYIDNAGKLNIKSCKAGTEFVIKSLNNICDDKWHNVLYTWDGTTNANSVKLYIDDMTVPESVTKATFIENIASLYNLTFGSLSGSSLPFVSTTRFIGDIDDFKIFNSILNAPTNLIASADNVKISLSWTATTTSGSAINYNVWRSERANGGYIKIASNISSTSYSDLNLNNGTTYYYVVSTVVDGFESPYSNEVSATPINPSVLLEVTSVEKAKIGDEITANIIIQNAKNICAEDIKISFDTSRLDYIGTDSVTGIKIYKEDSTTNTGAIRIITASLGKANAANGYKILIKLKFKAKAKGDALIDITNGRIADNATLEMNVDDANCGEKTIFIEGIRDVNRTEEYTLLDLGIAAWYYGDLVADTDSTKYDADQIENGIIDDTDLTEIVKQMLQNPNYPVLSHS